MAVYASALVKGHVRKQVSTVPDSKNGSRSRTARTLPIGHLHPLSHIYETTPASTYSRCSERISGSETCSLCSEQLTEALRLGSNYEKGERGNEARDIELMMATSG